jgi:hypothetical protein
VHALTFQRPTLDSQILSTFSSVGGQASPSAVGAPMAFERELARPHELDGVRPADQLARVV